MSNLDSESNELSPQPGPEEEEEELKRSLIRDNLSTLSFEELLKLKEKLGSKVYNETVHGASKNKASKDQPVIKRENKNRPREISSKIRPKQIKILLSNSASLASLRKHVPKDPRFDPKFGEFDKDKFKQNYHFINELKQKEKIALQQEYNECTDSNRKKTIKLLIQRIENQLREEEKIHEQKQREQVERMEIKEKTLQGEKHLYKKKSIKKWENLVEKYEELKKTNRLENHIQKKSRKLKAKDKRILAKIK
ncbi:hypothetical protein ABEB36_003356 [Hypothenemus hampei]|uniref:rRNA biogenesis protein RRP36 n=1 Tax=Hypothenemus hampei TaxID=57062 RepID=A0ABD1F8V7_HYPHA